MALINCPECGNSISEKAVSCPYCGIRRTKPFYKRWWFRLLAFVILAPVIVLSLLVGIFLFTDGGTGGFSNEDLEIVSYRILETNSGEKVVKGEIRNNSDVNLDLVILTVSGYDKDGKQVDDASTHCGYLGAGETWAFQTVGTMDKDVVTIKVTTLQGRPE